MPETKKAKKSQATVARARPAVIHDATDETEQDNASGKYVDLVTAVGRLVINAVESRLRHRALLEVLTAGDFTWERYVAKLDEIYDRDEEAVAKRLLFTDEAFQEHFGAWLEDDRIRYEFKRSKRGGTS